MFWNQNGGQTMRKSGGHKEGSKSAGANHMPPGSKESLVSSYSKVYRMSS